MESTQLMTLTQAKALLPQIEANENKASEYYRRTEEETLAELIVETDERLQAIVEQKAWKGCNYFNDDVVPSLQEVLSDKGVDPDSWNPEGEADSNYYPDFIEIAKKLSALRILPSEEGITILISEIKSEDYALGLLTEGLQSFEHLANNLEGIWDVLFVEGKMVIKLCTSLEYIGGSNVCLAFMRMVKYVTFQKHTDLDAD